MAIEAYNNVLLQIEQIREVKSHPSDGRAYGQWRRDMAQVAAGWGFPFGYLKYPKRQPTAHTKSTASFIVAVLQSEQLHKCQ